MKKILEYIKNPNKLLLGMCNINFFWFLSDKTYLKLKYWLVFNKKLNINNPKTFNEKLQWLKLNDRNIEYTKMVDKYEVKKYVASIIGEKYVIPAYGVYDNFDDIDFEKLPNQFVMKCTHDSGGLLIVKDKSKLNIKMAKKKFNKFLKKNYYYSSREWVYKNVKPRIVIEKYMEDSRDKSMMDYKFFCFNGIPKIMYISEGLEDHKTASMSFYDMNFKLTECKRKDYKPLSYTPKKPKNFEKMKEFASILSKDIPHLRVDFYEINGKLYFGEFTFYSSSGYATYSPDEWDLTLGNMLDLTEIRKFHEK